MRTTIDIPDETYRELKIKAAREGTPVRQIVLRGIERELGSTKGTPVRKLQLPLIRSSQPGTLNLSDEQIDEFAYGDSFAS